MAKADGKRQAWCDVMLETRKSLSWLETRGKETSEMHIKERIRVKRVTLQ